MIQILVMIAPIEVGFHGGIQSLPGCKSGGEIDSGS